MPPDELVHTLLGVAVLVAITATTLGLRRTPHPWAPAWAVLRGGLQLAAVALVLAGVIQNPWWVGLALLVMFSVAAWTATRRLGADLAHLGLVAGSMGAGVLVTLAVVFGTGALALTSRYALAIGGIVIGNSMSIATLVGRQATATISRESIHHALIPTTDQTRTTGLVTLPGAFVGAIFGGVSPLEAGRFQLVVLSAVMAAGSIAAVLLAHWLAPAATRPDPLG